MVLNYWCSRGFFQPNVQNCSWLWQKPLDFAILTNPESLRFWNLFRFGQSFGPRSKMFMNPDGFRTVLAYMIWYTWTLGPKDLHLFTPLGDPELLFSTKSQIPERDWSQKSSNICQSMFLNFRCFWNRSGSDFKGLNPEVCLLHLISSYPFVSSIL